MEEPEVTLDTLARIIKVGFDDLYVRIDYVETSLSEKIASLDERIDAVDASLRAEIRASREEMRQGLVQVNQVLVDHEERITKIERELAP